MGDLSKRFLKEREEEERRQVAETAATERRQKRAIGRYSRVGLGVSLGAVLIATPLILSAVAGERDPFSNIQDTPATVIQDDQSTFFVNEESLHKESKRVYDCGSFKVVSNQSSSSMPDEDYEALKNIKVFADGIQVQGFDPNVYSYDFVFRKYYDALHAMVDWSFQDVPEGWDAAVVENSGLRQSFCNMEYTGFSAEVALIIRSDSLGRAYRYEMRWGAGATLPLSPDSLNEYASRYYEEDASAPAASGEPTPDAPEGTGDPFVYDNGIFKTIIPESERAALNADSQDEEFERAKGIKVLINNAPLLGFDPRVHVYDLDSDDYEVVRTLVDPGHYSFQDVPEGWLAEIDQNRCHAKSCCDIYGGVSMAGEIGFNIGTADKVNQFTVRFGYTSPGFGHTPTAGELVRDEQQPNPIASEPEPGMPSQELVDLITEPVLGDPPVAYPDNGTFKTDVPEAARRAVSPVSNDDADALKGVKVLLGGKQLMGFDPQTHEYDLVFIKHNDAMAACDVRRAGELSFQDVPEGWVAEEVPESRLAKSFISEWPTDNANSVGYTGMSAEVSFVLRSVTGAEYTYRLTWGSGTSTPLTDESLNDDPRVSAPSMPMDESEFNGNGTDDQGAVPNPEANAPATPGTEPLPTEITPDAPTVVKQSSVFQECDDDAIVNNVTGYYERHQFSYAPEPLILLNKGCGDIITHMYAVDKGSFGEAVKGTEYTEKLLNTVTVDEGDHLAVYVQPTKLGEAHAGPCLGDVLIDVEVAENERYGAFSRTWRVVTDKIPIRIRLTSELLASANGYNRIVAPAMGRKYYNVSMLAGDTMILIPDALTVSSLSNPYPEWNVLPDYSMLKNRLEKGFQFSAVDEGIEVDPMTGIIKSDKPGSYRIGIRRDVDVAFTGAVTYADIQVISPSVFKPQPSLTLAGNRAGTLTTEYANAYTDLCSCTDGAGAITAKSSNDAIAKPVVNGRSVRMSVGKPGTATIAVSIAENSQYAALTKTFTVVVVKNPTKITLRNISAKLGSSIQIYGDITTGVSTNPLNTYQPGFIYKSSAPAIASVSKTGMVTAQKTGKAMITVTARGDECHSSSSATMMVTVVGKKVPTIDVISINGHKHTEGEIGWIIPLCEVTDGAGKVTATSSNTKVAGIAPDSYNPTIVYYEAKAVGTTNITVRVAGNANYQAATKTFKVTVGKNKVDVSVKKAAKVQVKKTKSLGVKLHQGYYTDGTQAPLAFAKPNVTYASTNPSVVSVDKNGKITGRKAGKATIVIKTAATKYYKATTTKVTVTVTK